MFIWEFKVKFECKRLQYLLFCLLENIPIMKLSFLGQWSLHHLSRIATLFNVEVSLNRSFQSYWRVSYLRCKKDTSCCYNVIVGWDFKGVSPKEHMQVYHCWGHQNLITLQILYIFNNEQIEIGKLSAFICLTKT